MSADTLPAVVALVALAGLIFTLHRHTLRAVEGLRRENREDLAAHGENLAAHGERLARIEGALLGPSKAHQAAPLGSSYGGSAAASNRAAAGVPGRSGVWWTDPMRIGRRAARRRPLSKWPGRP